MKRLKNPVLITAQGTLFPYLLLSSGWWERRGTIRKQSFYWRDPLQEWLFFGFEEWGPSWDISLSAKDEKNKYLFAQLWSGDEVNSLPIIIPGAKAKALRENLLDKRMVFEANIPGLLCHPSHLSETQLRWLGRFDKAYDYCIRLDEDDERHTISRRLEKTASYSGYLWQCLLPRAWVESMKTPPLDEVFFIWEHTDFAKPEAILYNLESLNHKVSYLQSRWSELVLLQKSSALVPGDSVSSAEQFYDSVLDNGIGNGPVYAPRK